MSDLLVPFGEAIAFLRQKLSLPTKTWRDIDGRAHDRALVVAGAMKTALLEDLRAEIQKAVEGKTTLADFRKAFDEIVQKHGWTGWAGEGSEKGRAWRTRVIFETNLKTAHAAGRWQQMTDPDVVKVRKWWRYRHAWTRVPENERLEHAEIWNGKVLAWDDPWWETHYPPNGWNCSCGVETLSDGDLEDEGLTPDKSPPVTYRDVRDTGTGQVIKVPNGIDLGWDHAPGRDWSRGMVPRELQKPLEPLMQGDAASRRVGAAAPPMPKPKALSAPFVDDEAKEELARRFLAAFGADIGRPASFRDASGHVIPISDSLFRDGAGNWKSQKRGRGAVVMRMAEALKDPDEIWLSWELSRDTKSPVLKRTYLRVDPETDVMGVFGWSAEGWHGRTVFLADDPGYIEKQRRGALVYRRPEK
jgi:hypothetical protein